MTAAAGVIAAPIRVTSAAPVSAASPTAGPSRELCCRRIQRDASCEPLVLKTKRLRRQSPHIGTGTMATGMDVDPGTSAASPSASFKREGWRSDASPCDPAVRVVAGRPPSRHPLNSSQLSSPPGTVTRGTVSRPSAPGSACRAVPAAAGVAPRDAPALSVPGGTKLVTNSVRSRLPRAPPPRHPLPPPRQPHHPPTPPRPSLPASRSSAGTPSPCGAGQSPPIPALSAGTTCMSRALTTRPLRARTPITPACLSRGVCAAMCTTSTASGGGTRTTLPAHSATRNGNTRGSSGSWARGGKAARGAVRGGEQIRRAQAG